MNQLNVIKITLAALLVAHLPLGIEYSLRMWRTGHYQFFPLLMGAAVWLVIDRTRKLKFATNHSTAKLTAFCVVNFLLLLLATLLYSSFVWSLSFFFWFGAAIYLLWGMTGLQRAWPAWALLLFVIPLPMNIDVILVSKMQFLASQLASWTLDAFELIHFRDGVVLITEKKQFFAEEACSGIRSLFSSLAFVCVFGILNRHSWSRQAINLMQAVFWVLIGNAARIAIVVYVADNWTDAIAHGTYHEMLGMAVFGFIVFLTLSTDRALQALRASPRDEFEDLVEIPVAAVRTGQTGAHPAIAIAGILVFSLLTLFAGRLVYAKISKEQLRNNRFSEAGLEAVAEAMLPESINGWKRSDFEHKIRNEASLFAPESYLWTYERGDEKLTLSLDRPYYEFHDLTVCYNGLGWQVTKRHEYDPAVVESNFTELALHKKSEDGLVLFSAIDQQGSYAMPLEYGYKNVFQVMADNASLAMGMNGPKLSGSALPIFQIQMLHTSPSKIESQAELNKVFLMARDRIRSVKSQQAGSL